MLALAHKGLLLFGANLNIIVSTCIIFFSIFLILLIVVLIVFLGWIGDIVRRIVTIISVNFVDFSLLVDCSRSGCLGSLVFLSLLFWLILWADSGWLLLERGDHILDCLLVVSAAGSICNCNIQWVSFSLSDSLASGVGFGEGFDFGQVVFGSQTVKCVQKHKLEVHVNVVLWKDVSLKED